MIESEQFLENLSTHLRNTITGGLTLATTLNHCEVSPAHLLFALAEEKGSVGIEILKKLKVDKKLIFNLLSITPKTEKDKETKKPKIPELSETAKRALEKAMLLAYEEEHVYVGTEHLLFGLVNCEDVNIESILKQAGVSIETAEEQIDIVLESTNKFPNLDDVKNTLEQISRLANSRDFNKNKTKKGKNKKRKNSILGEFTTDLTHKNSQKNLDPVVGREQEITRIIHILSRRTKNNPVLVGEPGVGKTAIIEGLARRIADGDVPYNLRGKKLLSLDLTLLISGTIYRGEFEARLKQVIDEISANSKYILFIDELHNIIGTGSNQGTMDAANILKPALARGKLRCIGATTLDEYKKYISTDPALERRFQSIEIDEPSIEEAKTILHGIKPHYEKFHDVDITDSAIEKAVEFSTRFIHENFLPDKAIDLIDEACAFVRTKLKNPIDEKIHNFKKELSDLKEEKSKAISQEKFKLAGELKKSEKDIKVKIKKLKKQKFNKKTGNLPKVEVGHIAEVLSARLNIEKENLLADDWQRVEKTSKQLNQHIKGQTHVVEEIKQKLSQSYLGLGNKNKPLASFLFVGPSGVGKTYTAKILAQTLYNNKKSLIKLDMSEFSESHSISKILGSPAGYVGHDSRNKFTEAIKKRPYSVVLFDEFDKAHPDVRKLLLQILDEGEITDSSGKKVKFNHSIIILTSNVGAELYKNTEIGFGKNVSKTLDEEKRRRIHNKVKKSFGGDVLSRLNSVCIFNQLSQKNIEQIIEKQIIDINKKLQDKRKINLVVSRGALKELAKNKYSEDFGARDIERKVTQTIQELLINALNKKTEQDTYSLQISEGKYELV
ncbi:MAG: ATP-dependent Clp protease ATP-binding subunit [Candidatus Magasanikbacteria bacterium]|nr:ATP-dependent Clp protease ATP-binding subunit [Candidatus Magasanikbacteria bacterium]